MLQCAIEGRIKCTDFMLQHGGRTILFEKSERGHTAMVGGSWFMLMSTVRRSRRHHYCPLPESRSLTSTFCREAPAIPPILPSRRHLLTRLLLSGILPLLTYVGLREISRKGYYRERAGHSTPSRRLHQAQACDGGVRRNGSR